jgi:hypothetical protein
MARFTIAVRERPFVSHSAEKAPAFSCQPTTPPPDTSCSCGAVCGSCAGDSGTSVYGQHAELLRVRPGNTSPLSS